LRAFFQQALRWAGPKQSIGIFHEGDFNDTADDDSRILAIGLLQAGQKRCLDN
jgi:hypothetical protein